MSGAVNTGRKRIFLWLAAAFLAVAFFGGVGVFFGLRSAERSSNSTPAKGRVAATALRQPTSFADLSESDIPGRYKWSEGDKSEFIVLYDDHTFMNKDGTTYPTYRWELLPDNLSITWQSGVSRMTNFEGAGVYSFVKSRGTLTRMEKQPPSAGPETAASNLTASIRFGAVCETNGLIPVNTSGDGQIHPGEAGGEPCYHLIRKPNRPEAFLYLRLAGRFKETSFSNAVITVEYFDSPVLTARPGSFYLQYDSGGPSAYLPTVERVALTGSQTWKEATFFLEGPRFRNRQNALGDFRLCAANPDLSVRAVKVVKNAATP